jgi:hypothetical protein
MNEGICDFRFAIGDCSGASRTPLGTGRLHPDPGLIIAAKTQGPHRTRLFAGLFRSIARRDLKPRNQHKFQDLIIIRPVMTINDHHPPAGGQGGIVLVFDQQATPIRHMDNERVKRTLVKQSPNLVGFHLAPILALLQIPASAKRNLNSGPGAPRSWRIANLKPQIH